MRIDVHIERLVLDGLPVEQRHAAAIQAAVEAELGRLMAAGSLATNLSSGGAIPALTAPGLQLARNSEPATLGRQIARSIHGGIAR